MRNNGWILANRKRDVNIWETMELCAQRNYVKMWNNGNKVIMWNPKILRSMIILGYFEYPNNCESQKRNQKWRQHCTCTSSRHIQLSMNSLVFVRTNTSVVRTILIYRYKGAFTKIFTKVRIENTKNSIRKRVLGTEHSLDLKVSLLRQQLRSNKLKYISRDPVSQPRFRSQIPQIIRRTTGLQENFNCLEKQPCITNRSYLYS